VARNCQGKGRRAVTHALCANGRKSLACLGAVLVIGLVAACKDRLEGYPTMPTCTFEITPASRSHGSGAGTGTVIVTASSGACDWTAAGVELSWVTLANNSGKGDGTVNYSVAANAGEGRTGILTIAGRSFTITQASGCVYTVSPTSVNVGATGGTGTVSVRTTSACGWTATSQASWLAITQGATGSGNGTVTFSVSGNTGAQRSGTLTVGGQRITVTQTACTYSVSPTSTFSDMIPKAGGTRTINVSTYSTCSWTATSATSWLTITRGATGSGSGTVTVSATANPTTSYRTGYLSVAGRGVDVWQDYR